MIRVMWKNSVLGGNPSKISYSYLRSLFLSVKSNDKGKPEVEESPLKRLLDESADFNDAKPLGAQQKWATMPYPEETKIRKQGDFYRQQSKRDPKESSVVLFPGQGSQYVGMGRELQKFPMARDLFELASSILRYDLLQLCVNGPKNELDQTRYAQPAILVTSLAAIERMKEERPMALENCAATAGFSLGEITALIFSGALEFERGLQLVKVRAEAMQLASEAYRGGMVTVIYGPDSKLSQACVKAKEWAIDRGDPLPECKVANYLYPHCKVVAGSISALEFLEKNAKEYNLRKVIRLPVSGAFHCNMMQPALEPFKQALKKITINDPIISVYSNVDGKKYRNAEHIRRQLPKQIVRPVCWEQLLHVIYERTPDTDFPNTFECGPGTSLRTVLKQVNAKAWNSSWSMEG